MFKKNASGRRVAVTLLAIALSACGSVQGASPARAGVPSTVILGELHLTEFDPNDAPGAAGLLGGEYPPAPASITDDRGGSGTRVAPALVP